MTLLVPAPRNTLDLSHMTLAAFWKTILEDNRHTMHHARQLSDTHCQSHNASCKTIVRHWVRHFLDKTERPFSRIGRCLKALQTLFQIQPSAPMGHWKNWKSIEEPSNFLPKHMVRRQQIGSAWKTSRKNLLRRRPEKIF